MRLKASVAAAESRGEPLPVEVRTNLERTFNTSLADVRVHTGSHAQNVAVTLSARAVTQGTNILLGPGERPTDIALIAHEVAHVVQQRGVVPRERGAPAPAGGGAAQRWTGSGGDHYEHEAQRAAAAAVSGQTFTVRERTGRPLLQRLGIGDLLDKLAGMAEANIPGYDLFTLVIGINPINMSRRSPTAANILRAGVRIMPGGGLISRALDEYGVFEKVGTWVEQQVRTLGLVGSALRDALMQYIDTVPKTDIIKPWTWGGHLDRAIAILASPAKRLWDFVVGLVAGILDFLREAILKPLAGLAKSAAPDTYDLLCMVLGSDPITKEDKPFKADTAIPAFLKLIGEQETWERIQKTGAIGKISAWFNSNLATLLGFVSAIPGLVVSTVKSITIEDILPLTNLFVKVGKAFGGFVSDFIGWIGKALWNLLEIIFEVVSPGALGYVKKTGAALKQILKDPGPFVGNLVKAAKGGFDAFAGNFGAHLKKGLINWLTGSLPGVYIPSSFSLVEIVKFVLSVLGLTWGNIRPKLVKATSENIVKAMEAGFDLVKTLVTKGPAAFWEQLKAHLANLQDQVVSGIISMVVGLIVQKAIPKVVAMFIPGAGFIALIVSIYDIIMTFVNRLKQIAAAVMAFVDSIVAIAAGQIGAAVKKVESVLASLLSLAIAFLFGFAGLGKVADKVMGVINKIRAPIDKALDALIAWVVNMAKKLFAKVFGKDGKPDQRTDAQKKAALDAALKEAGAILSEHKTPVDKLGGAFRKIRDRHKLTSLDPVAQPIGDGTKEKVKARGVINPAGDTPFIEFVHGMPRVDLKFKRGEYDEGEYKRQIKDQETGLRSMKVAQWRANRDAFIARAASSGSGRHPGAESAQARARRIVISALVIAEVNRRKAAGEPYTPGDVRAEINALFPGTAVLHAPDQIAGGEFDKFAIDINVFADKKKLRSGELVMSMTQARKVLGNLNINSSIGSQWKDNAPTLDTQVKDHEGKATPEELKQQNMNARLQVV